MKFFIKKFSPLFMILYDLVRSKFLKKWITFGYLRSIWFDKKEFWLFVLIINNMLCILSWAYLLSYVHSVSFKAFILIIYFLRMIFDTLFSLRTSLYLSKSSLKYTRLLIKCNFIIIFFVHSYILFWDIFIK